MDSEDPASHPQITEQTHPAAEHARRNHRLGVTAGAVGGLARWIIHPELIIAGFVYALTKSLILVALVAIISKAGILAFQLWTSNYLDHRPRKIPILVLLIHLRAIAFVGLLGGMWLLSRQVNALSLTLFFTAYLLTWICAGAGYLIFLDVVGRTIPTNRVGSFFALRNILGTVLGIFAGILIVQPVLDGVALPSSYLLLAAIGGALTIVDMSIFSRCREGDGPRAKRQTTLRESLDRGFEWLKKDRNYRRFFWVRVAFRISHLSLAFFIPYGTQKLQFETKEGFALLGGIMITTMNVGQVVSGLIWGKIADRRGFRPPLIGAGVCFALAPSLALLAPMLPKAYSIPIPATAAALDLPLTVYFLALMALGAAFQSNMIGTSCFFVSTGPVHRRPSYVGFLNTITSPFTLLPLAGAFLGKKVGMSAIFVVAMVGGLLLLFSALRIHSPTPQDTTQ